MSAHRIWPFNLVALLLMTLFWSGCATESVTYHTYDIDVVTDPPGAYVYTSVEGVQIPTRTPTTIQGEYELRTFEKHQYWWVPLVAGGVMAVGGTAMIVGSTGESAGDINVGLLVPGIFSVMIGLGIPGLSLMAYMQDGSQSIRLPGERRWQRVGTDLPEEQILRALPRLDLRLSQEGYLDRTIDVRPGDRLALELSVDPDAPVVASAPRRALTESPVEPGSAPDRPAFVGASPQATAHALIIGIEGYRNLPEPTGARTDAEEFARMLRETMGVPARNIRILVDEDATRSDILSELANLQANASAGSRVYFFFSGHGSPDVENGRSFLLPFEGTPENLAISAVALDEIISALEDTGARDVLAFVDACFSGTGDRSVLPEGLRPLVPVQEPEAPSQVALFTASGAREVSGTLPGTNIGLFTHHLLNALGRGLADINGDGQISLAELQAYVTPRVARDAREASRNQNPTLRLGTGLEDPAHVIVSWGVPAQ